MFGSAGPPLALGGKAGEGNISQTLETNLQQPLPPDEAARLAALRSLEILDTASEESFDELTALAASICQTPIALVSLVDEDRQWFKSRVGWMATATPRDVSFCAHTILDRDLLIIPDASADERFANSPLVTSDPGIRFYAGAPLVNAEGHALGTLCVIDRRPRELTAEQAQALRILSHQVVALIETRRNLAELARLTKERLQAEQALAQERYLLHTLVDNLPDNIYFKDAASRFLRINKALTTYFGLTDPAQAIGKTDFDFFTEEHARPAYEDEQQILRTGQPVVGKEEKETWLDGRVRWVSTTKMPFRDRDGKIIGTFGLAREITKLKLAEQALRESEERFRGTFENAAVGIAHTDLEGRFLRVNQKLCDILGYSREELLTRSIPDITHTEDWAADREHFGPLLRGEVPSFSRDKRYLRKDGAPVWVAVSVSLQRDAAGTPLNTIGAVREITHRKRLEKELRQAKEVETERARLAELGRDVGIALSQGDTLRDLLQPCAEAFVRFLDAAFARIWWLPPGSDVLELQASAGMYTHLDGAHARIPIGQLKIGRIAQDRRPVLTNDVQADPCISDPDWARREGMVAFAGFPLVVKDRLLGVLGMFSRRPLSGAVLQALESVAGVIALGIERKQQEVELRRAVEAAEAANRAKNEFLALVSHEIRTPMNAILGMTELTLESELTEDQRQCLRTVKSAADNLLGIINALLDFSKIEAGKLELAPADFSLRAAVGDTVRALAVRAHKKGLELICQVQPDVPDALVGDAGRLRQILLNLVGNAIKFTDEGEVEVRVQVVSGGEVNRESEAQGLQSLGLGTTHHKPFTTHLRFIVRDTGIGIPKDQQQRIFHAFEQQDTSTTRKYEGTGLGLTIASRLVALMGGKITVESAPDRGSTFTFTVQLEEQPQQPEPATAQPPVLLRDLPVLIVDDNATNRQIFEGWLRGWQMKPAAVADGLAALDALWHGAACGRRYALVLLDARMPNVDGLALAAQIRQRRELAATRIILLTSGDRPGDLARSHELQVNAHLLKPVQPDELLETIYRVMSRDMVSGRVVGGEWLGVKGQESAPLATHHTPLTTHLRILVAEDNEFNAQLLEQLLVRRGHRVRLATNGREALAVLGIRSQEPGARSQESGVRSQESGVRSQESGGNFSLTPDPRLLTPDFDLLLLDIHMPELDGFQVVHAVRERERTMGGHLPVIALTARSRKEDRERCLAAGMDDFLAKPIQAVDLWAAIDRVVAMKSQGSGVRSQESGIRSQESGGDSSQTPDSSLLIPDFDLLDPRVLMAACGGDAIILEGICQAFRDHLPDYLATVQNALRGRDTLRLREAAHNLSGMVAAFSTVAGSVASQLEDHAAQGQLEEARPLVQQLEVMGQQLTRVVGGLSVETLRQQIRSADDPNRTASP
jgi:PAS domain S-box-containing protein